MTGWVCTRLAIETIKTSSGEKGEARGKKGEGRGERSSVAFREAFSYGKVT